MKSTDYFCFTIGDVGISFFDNMRIVSLEDGKWGKIIFFIYMKL